MSRNSKIVVGAVVVVVAGVFFFAGMYAAGVSNPWATLTGSIGGFAGQVTAVSASSLTVKLADGSTKTFTITQSTPVFEQTALIPKTLRDVTTGSQVMVTFDGTTAQGIQLMPKPQQAPSTPLGAPPPVKAK